MTFPGSTDVPPLLDVQGLARSFGGVRAVVDGALTVSRPGVVHALMGANGCGKSTTLKILSGQLRPDRGAVRLAGRPVEFHHPHDAVRSGISMVAQETAVALSLSVTENVLMGALDRRSTLRGIDWTASHERAEDVVRRLGLTVDPRTPVGRLRPDQQQVVEIARAISRGSRIVILDEPTSSLAEDRVEDLHRAVRRLTEQGASVILVSHRLDEVFELADEMTVMRDGTTVAAGPARDFDVDRLVSAMTGPAAGTRSAAVRGDRPARGGTPTLRVRGLSTDGELTDVELDVHPGEVVGLAGLEGSGRSVVLSTIFGHTRASAGEVEVEGTTLRPGSIRHSIGTGVAYLPPDRKRQGLVTPLSAQDNLALATTSRRPRLALRQTRSERRIYDTVRSTMRLRSSSASARVVTLSGGNQQKIALGKWLDTTPRVLLLDEPTRGVDVVAKDEIHARLRQLSETGVAILVSSSETDELTALCDRIVVLFRGRVVGTLHREEYSDHTLTALSGGHR